MEKLKIGNMNVSFLSATRYHINGGILLMVIAEWFNFVKGYSTL